MFTAMCPSVTTDAVIAPEMTTRFRGIDVHNHATATDNAAANVRSASIFSAPTQNGIDTIASDFDAMIAAGNAIESASVARVAVPRRRSEAHAQITGASTRKC